MENITLDILNNVILYCDFKTLNSIKNINKFFFNVITFTFENIYRSKKLKYVKNILHINKFKIFFMDRLSDDNILNLRQFNIKNRISYTGYIDFIQKKDFDKLNTNIIYGYDMHDRFFLSFLFYTKYKNNIYYKILTIFQRYSNDENFYVTCQDKLYNYPYVEKLYILNNTIYSFNDQFIKDIFSLLNDKKLIIKNKNHNYIIYFDKCK